MLLAMRVLKHWRGARPCLFTIGPIQLSYEASGVMVYLAMQRHLEEANNPYASTSARLKAAINAAQEALRL
jgi:hypothetical protein